MAWVKNDGKATLFKSPDEADKAMATLPDRTIHGFSYSVDMAMLPVEEDQTKSKIAGWIVTLTQRIEGFPNEFKYLKYTPKPVILPAEVWTDAYITQNMVGSITHVSYGSYFFATEEECQHYIDTRPRWVGGGGPSSYRPIQLVKGK